MSRKYSDPSYGVKQVLAIDTSDVALNGTVTSTTAKQSHTFMHPVTVKDFNAVVTIAGTAVDTNLLLCKSAAGTGALSAIGTITLTGTKTANQVIDATATETDFSTGDDIVVARAAGTETETAIRAKVYVQFTERFVDSDT